MEVSVEKKVMREFVTFENQGSKLFGILHRPVGVEKAPVVVSFHGFASSKLGTNRSWVRIGEQLAEEGVAFFRFDFRGAGDSEGELADMTLEGFVSDARAAVRALERMEGLDLSRLGFFGASLGGTIATLTAAREENVKALALWAPVASGMLWFQDFLANNADLASVDPSEALSTYRGVKLNPAFKEEFATLFADKIAGSLTGMPLLHMHGERDETISIRHQGAYKAAREGVEAESRFITYPDIDHVLGLSDVFPEVTQEVVKWFQKHL